MQPVAVTEQPPKNDKNMARVSVAAGAALSGLAVRPAWANVWWIEHPGFLWCKNELTVTCREQLMSAFVKVTTVFSPWHTYQEEDGRWLLLTARKGVKRAGWRLSRWDMAPRLRRQLCRRSSTPGLTVEELTVLTLAHCPQGHRKRGRPCKDTSRSSVNRQKV